MTAGLGGCHAPSDRSSSSAQNEIAVAACELLRNLLPYQEPLMAQELSAPVKLRCRASPHRLEHGRSDQ